jgi:hypothetical protein
MILKRLSLAALGIVSSGALAYGVCLWQTGITVERQFVFQTEQVNRSGVAEVELTFERGWFTSFARVVVKPLAEQAIEIPFEVEVEHDFFSAHFDVGLGNDAAVAGLFAPSAEPLVFVADVSLNPIQQTVSSSGYIQLAALDGAFGSTHIRLQPSEVSWRSSPLVIEYLATIGDLVLQSDIDTIELDGGDAQVTGAFEPSQALGALISELTASFVLKHLFWQDKLNGESLKLEGVAVSVDQMVDAGRSYWSIGLGADQLTLSVQGQQYPMQQPNAQLTVDVDEQAFAEFIARYNQMYDPAPYEVAELLNPVTQQGVGVTVHDFSFEVLGEQARVTAKWTLNGFDATTALISPVVLVPVSTLDAHLEVPVQIAERLPESTQDELDLLINQGIFEEQDGQWVSEIRFDRGALTVNDRPFSLLKM